MRQIKFKAKRIDNGEWVEGDLVHNSFDGSSKNIEIGIRVSNGIHYNFPVEVDPSTVCQYTGLTDKNGEEVFEGDLFKHVYFPLGVNKDAVEYYKIGEVVDYAFVIWMFEGLNVLDESKAMSYQKNCKEVYQHPTAGIGWVDKSQLHNGTTKNIEVIGNIHDK